MLKDLLSKFYSVDPTKVVLIVQLVILLAFIFASVAASQVALAGFADGGMPGSPAARSLIGY